MLWEFRRRPEIGVKSSQPDSENEILSGVRRSCYREALFLLISAVGNPSRIYKGEGREAAFL